jgi:ABC-type uncharacterized transport system substrate-binding protein
MGKVPKMMSAKKRAKSAKKRTTSVTMLRILAVAVGQSADTHITVQNPPNVRPYVTGLIDGLSAKSRVIGTHYDIWYRLRPASSIATTDFGPGGDGVQNNLIFPMSTRVLKLASSFTSTVPIVSPTGSDPQADRVALGANVAVINARRSQTADGAFENFLASVPSLQQVYVLYDQSYGPSTRALALIQADQTANFTNVTLTPEPVTEASLASVLSSLPTRNVNNPALFGVLILPVDFLIGEGVNQAPKIISSVQGQNHLPVFFPIPDWVGAQSPAFGAYGVSQYQCGFLAANLVNQILWLNISPATLGVEPAPFRDLEWEVSKSAAQSLNINITGLPACAVVI